MSDLSLTTTRILYADIDDAGRSLLVRQAELVGLLRRALWQRMGGHAPFKLSLNEMRMLVTRWYRDFHGGELDGTVRNESSKDILNDILTCKDAALVKIGSKVSQRLAYEKLPESERKAEYKRRMKLVRQGDYEGNPFLHRTVRKIFVHGQAHADNQFIVRSDKHQELVRDGHLIIRLRLCKGWIELVTRSNGKNVNLIGRNLRIILRDDRIEIHFPYRKTATRPCGSGEVGIDKGMREAIVDSNGHHYGSELGNVLDFWSRYFIGKERVHNQLRSLADQHEERGNLAKADRIRRNNLGIRKLNRKKDLYKAEVGDICYNAAHQLADRYGHVVSEDLSWQSSAKKQWRGKIFNRRMSRWTKGVLAKTLEEVFHVRGVCHDLVNAAYTSQMDSRTGRLEGIRQGETFTGIDGVVQHADENAARNILMRFFDTEITRYMPAKTVKDILLKRSSDATGHQEASVGSSRRQRSADYRLQKCIRNSVD